MKNNLMIFEGNEIEILTKEDVNFEFNGECLFNGKQTCKLLEYSNDRDAISKHIRENQKVKLKNSDVAKHDFRKLNNAGETFITEKGVMKLIINSKMPKADEFEDLVWDIVSEVQASGKYDSIEQQLKLIEDDTERQLKLTIYQLQNVLKVNPNDMVTVLNLNNKQNELNTYLQNKKLDKVEKEINKLNDKIKKTTVLREGNISAEIIAKKLNVFSIKDNPHNKFAECMLKTIGYYVKPEGNTGYQDDYISINLTTRGGVTIPTIKYSKKCLEEFEKYIDENGLHIEQPPQLYKRNGKNNKKGDFMYGKIIFDEIDEYIKINETTYKIYTSENENY